MKTLTDDIIYQVEPLPLPTEVYCARVGVERLCSYLQNLGFRPSVNHYDSFYVLWTVDKGLWEFLKNRSERKPYTEQDKCHPVYQVWKAQYPEWTKNDKSFYKRLGQVIFGIDEDITYRRLQYYRFFIGR